VIKSFLKTHGLPNVRVAGEHNISQDSYDLYISWDFYSPMKVSEIEQGLYLKPGMLYYIEKRMGYRVSIAHEMLDYENHKFIKSVVENGLNEVVKTWEKQREHHTIAYTNYVQLQQYNRDVVASTPLKIYGHKRRP
jgi:hypothetical protein